MQATVDPNQRKAVEHLTADRELRQAIGAAREALTARGPSMSQRMRQMQVVGVFDREHQR